MPKQQFQAFFFIIRRIVYLAWLFYIFWWHTSLLLFDWLKLDPTTKGRPIEWKIKWVYWWLIKPNSLKKVCDASFCRTFPLFPCSYQNVVTDRMKDQMSLSDDLSSQTHWRRFVMHPFAEPFHCFHVPIKTW